ETLRRFRTFSATALMRGEAPDPALDGLRPNERRVMALLTAWTNAAAELIGPDGDGLQKELTPLLNRFRLALRTRTSSRQASGKPRSTRRAVSAAIDRVADVFLAIDTTEGTIADANPAAGALLNVERDALLGVDFFSFAPESERDHWWSQLDSLAEGNEAVRFPAHLQDVAGRVIPLDASATRFSTRSRTLALVVLRPDLPAAEDSPGLTALLARPRSSSS
ncbi:MAG: PAS domain-containing protein, partial [Myxococcota bacterium]